MTLAERRYLNLSRFLGVEPMMTETKQVYRNTHFTKRNYECTNVVACELVDDSAKVPDGYEQADAAFSAYVRNLTPLWIEAGVRYYGYL